MQWYVVCCSCCVSRTMSWSCLKQWVYRQLKIIFRMMPVGRQHLYINKNWLKKYWKMSPLHQRCCNAVYWYIYLFCCIFLNPRKLNKASKLNIEDAMDRCKWRKVIKDVRWSGWVWVGECFFWYRPTRVVPDKRLLNSCVLCVFLNPHTDLITPIFIFLYLVGC